MTKNYTPEGTKDFQMMLNEVFHLVFVFFCVFGGLGNILQRQQNPDMTFHGIMIVSWRDPDNGLFSIPVVVHPLIK